MAQNSDNLKEENTSLALLILEFFDLFETITSWQIGGETMETLTDFILGGGGAPKSLQMVTAVMKLKDTCSLEEKL